MSEIIRIRLDDTEAHDIEVHTFEEITVQEYISIADGHHDKEEPHETLKRVFGVPSRIARIMRLHEIYGVLGAYAKLLEDGKAAWAKAHDIRRLLKEEDEQTKVNWTAERARQIMREASLHRDTITVEGQEFIVPQDIDLDGTYGQLLDLQSVCDMDMSETARLPHILAIYCLKKGEGYGPAKLPGETPQDHQRRFDLWKEGRVALFHKARMIDTQAVCAFFFSSSSAFRGTTSRIFPSWKALLLPSNGVEQPSTANTSASTPT